MNMEFISFIFKDVWKGLMREDLFALYLILVGKIQFSHH